MLRERCSPATYSKSPNGLACLRCDYNLPLLGHIGNAAVLPPEAKVCEMPVLKSMSCAVAFSASELSVEICSSPGLSQEAIAAGADRQPSASSTFRMFSAAAAFISQGNTPNIDLPYDIKNISMVLQRYQCTNRTWSHVGAGKIESSAGREVVHSTITQANSCFVLKIQRSPLTVV